MNNEALRQVIARLLIAGEIPATTLANWLVAVDLQEPLTLQEQQVLRSWIDDPETGLVESQRELLVRSLGLGGQKSVQNDEQRSQVAESASPDGPQDDKKINKSNKLNDNWWDALPETPQVQDFVLAPASESISGDEHIDQQELRGILRVLAEESQDQDAPDSQAQDVVALQDLDPLTFHLSLSQWIDDERVQVQTKIDPQNVWDYDFWKADLIARDPLDEARRARIVSEDKSSSTGADGSGEFFAYTVDVYFGEEAQPRRYQYWVELDGDGQPQRSDWIAQAPSPANKNTAFSNWSGRKRSSALLDADLLREIYLKSIAEHEAE